MSDISNYGKINDGATNQQSAILILNPLLKIQLINLNSINWTS